MQCKIVQLVVYNGYSVYRNGLMASSAYQSSEQHASVGFIGLEATCKRSNTVALGWGVRAVKGHVEDEKER